MKTSLHNKHYHRYGVLLALIIFAASFLLAQIIYGSIKKEMSSELRETSLDLSDTVKGKIQNSKDVLVSHVGLFAVSENVARSEWSEFVNSQDTLKKFPGIRALAYISWVKEDSKLSFVDSIKEEGFLEFEIIPAEEKANYYVVNYIEPILGNESAFGFDLSSNKDRKDTFDLSRDSNSFVLTPPITLVQGEDDDGLSFLAVLPIYKKVNVDSLISRRENLVGFVDTVISANESFKPIEKEFHDIFGVEFSLVDVSEKQEFFKSEYYSTAGHPNHKIDTVENIQIGGRTWQIRSHPNDLFFVQFKNDILLPKIIVLAGALVSLLVFFIFAFLEKSRKTAIELAEDMTSRFEGEVEKVIESRDRLEIAQNAAKFGVWDWDVIKDSLSWDYKMHDLYGTSFKDKSVGAFKSWEAVLHPDDKEIAGKAVKDALMNRSLMEFSSRIIRPDNKEVRYIKTMAKIFRNKEGVAERMVGVSYDITEERTYAEKIKVGRDKLEAIISNIADAILATDVEGKIVSINKQAEILLGLSQKDAVGNYWYEVFQTKNGQGKYSPIFEGQSIKTGWVTGQKSMQDDFYIVRHDSDITIPITASTTPIVSDGKTSGIIIAFRDITTQKEIDEVKTEFVSLASHQLRTPLSAIGWYSEMLLDGDVGVLNDDQKGYVQEIFTGNQRMVDLVNALLNVSRLELGTFTVEPEILDIRDILSAVEKDLAPKIEANGTEVKITTSEDVPKMNLDKQLITMVFQNLLSNAIKYSLKDGHVDLSVEKVDQKIVIKIKDDGMGIPEQEQRGVFTKLFRAGNARANVAEGTGLGLYIIRKIVVESGGTIDFVSEENKGTTFIVKLPLTGMKKKVGPKQLA